MSFTNATDDSLFISQHSDVPYEQITVSYMMQEKLSGLDSAVFYHGESGMIIGPYDAETHFAYIKVQSIDSSLFMHVGNVFLSPQKRGISVEATRKLADSLAASVHHIDDYKRICSAYSDDSNTSPACELDWFSEGVMVASFEKEIKKHHKGDCFVAYTEYGYHVVMLLDESIRKRSRVRYCILYLKK